MKEREGKGRWRRDKERIDVEEKERKGEKQEEAEGRKWKGVLVPHSYPSVGRVTMLKSARE